MKFNLSLHLVEVQREEKEHKYSLADYTKFISLTVDLHNHLPQYQEGAGSVGPPFQTIKHNARFLSLTFPHMRSEFAEGITEEINFKFKEITEAMEEELKVKKQEKQLKYKKLCEQQKKSVESILALLSKVSKSTKMVGLFDTPQRTPKQPPKSLNLNLHLEDQKDSGWHNADKIISQMRLHHFKQFHILQNTIA